MENNYFEKKKRNKMVWRYGRQGAIPYNLIWIHTAVFEKPQ